jgi:hypothetical protein
MTAEKYREEVAKLIQTVNSQMDQSQPIVNIALSISILQATATVEMAAQLMVMNERLEKGNVTL